ncbi:MAG: DUF2249 domain-containing protein [Opitutaceae bacterium]
MKTENQSQPAPAQADGTLFDVRPISPRVKHAQIFQRWLDLPTGRHFVLLNDHDPVPLRYQFEAEFPGAFTWEYLTKGPEEFRVKITKVAPIPAEAAPKATVAKGAPEARAVQAAQSGAVREVDARGLEPPEPLIRILDALEALPCGGVLRARTDREPCHLFGEAEARGFSHECQAQEDGSWLTTLTHA